MTFEKWIKHIIETEKPGKEINAYYFGLIESDDVDYTLYLSGSNEFDLEDEDWACNDDFEPKEKYLPLPQYNGLDWQTVLNETVELLQKFIKSDIFKDSFFAKAQGIAVGFDDGNLVLIKQ